MMLLATQFPQQITPTTTNQASNNNNNNNTDEAEEENNSNNNNMQIIKGLSLEGSIDYDPEGIPSSDFGGIFSTKALAVVTPSTTDDIAKAVKEARKSRSLTVSARGNGHSTHGQAMAAGGIILDMRSTLKPIEVIRIDGRNGTPFADVGGGALWREVLQFCLVETGLAPRSWTDYLGLTVGGTLSNAGISGQCFRYGPQTSNVAQLEVVTGRGDVLVCSEKKNSDLFFSVLGGLGQFGVITRARIPLHPAPDMVRWSRMVYSEFENYSRDAELLIGREEGGSCLDYVEGFAFLVGDAEGEGSVPLLPHQKFESFNSPLSVGSVAYCLEVALNYSHDDHPSEIAKVMEGMIGGLSYCKGLRFEAEVSYVEFLLRVEESVKEGTTTGLRMAHPWLNLLVSRKDIVEFDRVVLKPMLKAGAGGPVLLYPLLRHRWDERASTAVPKGEVFYLVALLRSCERGEKAEVMLGENEKVVGVCRGRGMDFKVYVPHYRREEEWREHFGDKWEGLVEKKTLFDPCAVLAPGQNIFSRNHTSLSR